MARRPDTSSASRETLSALGVAALDYAERLRWPIFPCNPDKSPKTTNGVYDATTNPETIGAWWKTWPNACIGLDVTGAGLIAIDRDAYKPEYDAKAFAALGFPETKLRQRSARGGFHDFYAIAEGELIAGSASKLAPCVDVKGLGGYVLLAPSATAHGQYEWLEQGKPTYRTDEMKRLAASAKEKSRDRNNWIISADLPENIAAARKWLKTDAKPAIRKQGGDAMCLKTGMMMKSYGLSQAMAFEVMREDYPSWDNPETLLTKIENAYAYNSSAPGNMTAAYKQAKNASLFTPKPLTIIGAGEEYRLPNNPYRAVDRAGMNSIVPPTWLVDDFIPSDAYAMLFGAPGTFKSFIALDIALSIATGAAANPIWSVAKAGNVLYCAGEGRSHVTPRVAAWERQHFMGQEATGFVLMDPIPSVTENWRPFFDVALKASPEGYALTVIDTTGISMGGSNEGAFEAASLFTKKVRETILVLGGSVLAIHHVGHDTRGRPIGSSAFIRDPDTMVRVERDGKAMVVRLHMTKQRDGTEWPKAKGLGMMIDGASLAAVKADAPAAETAAQSAVKRKDDAKAIFEASAVDKIIDAAIKDELAKNKTGAYSQRKLAEKLAVRPDIEIGSTQLRLNVLTRLRETNGTYANKAFNPNAHDAVRWRYFTEEK